MPRERDEPIPADEDLYRGVMASWVSDDGRVLPDAIDSKGSSCVRAKYGTAADAKVVEKGRTGVARTRVEQLPVPTTLCNGVEYEGFAADEPSEGEAHAEIRARRTADRFSRECMFPKGGAAKQELKTLLARSFTIVEQPAAVGAVG